MDRTELAANLAAIATTLGAMNTAVAKIGTETQSLLDKIGTLEDTIANSGFTTPEIDAALAAVHDQAGLLTTALDAVDAKVPDPEEPTP